MLIFVKTGCDLSMSLTSRWDGGFGQPSEQPKASANQDVTLWSHVGDSQYSARRAERVGRLGSVHKQQQKERLADSARYLNVRYLEHAHR